MRAITHISFGLLTLGLVSSFTKLPLSLEIIITASLSSLLPDIDTTKSTIGKVLKPISSFLDTKFGHRTITHSLLACIFLAIISLPLLFLKTNYYQALQIGYFSHLMIDCINKTGIPFFYPNNTFFVFPSSPKWRIEVGSLAEYILCGLIILATFGIWYLNGIGFRSWLSGLLASPELAVKEYRSHANKYKMSVKVKGFYILSQKEVNNQVFEIIDSESDKTLIVKNKNNKLITIGENPNNTIQAQKMVIIKDKPIKIKTEPFKFAGQSLDLMFDYIDENTFISGTVEANERPKYLKMDLKPFETGEFENIKVSAGLSEYDSKLELKNATLKQLKPLKKLGITGELVSRKVF